MNPLARLSLGILLTATVTLGCSGSSSNNTPGTGGTSGGGTSGGGTTGNGGTTGSGGTGGADPSFMAFQPCAMESSYVSGTTIAFGGAVGFNYSPACLKVSPGATVTFNGEFVSHPLVPSAMRGVPSGSNPIVNMSDGTTAAFTFPNAGFYAYLCNFHGTDDGAFMAGVIWVK
jgi:plastocyanin